MALHLLSQSLLLFLSMICWIRDKAEKVEESAESNVNTLSLVVCDFTRETPLFLSLNQTSASVSRSLTMISAASISLS